MGPLEAQKPWNTRDIVGMTRFLNARLAEPRRRRWKRGHRSRRSSTRRSPKRSIARCTARSRRSARTSTRLRFNTAIAELIKLNNEMTASST